VSGLFVTVEGIDGTGKSTQVRRLAAALRAEGREVVETLEPGGTALGRALRELLLHTDGPVDARAEALLYAADRAQHVARVIDPALAAGAVVLCDRYLDSSIAYQGAGRSLSADEIRGLSLWATGGRLPDLTVLLDLPVAEAGVRRARKGEAPDRLEREDGAFHERVRRAFLDLADAEPERFLVVDARQSADRIAARALDRVHALHPASDAAHGVSGGR
jgi:dTMP kinase